MARTAVTRQSLSARALIMIISVLVLAAVVILAIVRQPEPPEATPKTSPTYMDSGVVISDRFNRALDHGWGSADVGGAYRADSDVSLAVVGGRGRMNMPSPGLARTATLSDVQPRDLEASVDVVVSTTPNGGSGAYAALHVRSDGASYYRAALHVGPDRLVYLNIDRFDGRPDAPVLLREAVMATKVKPGKPLRLTFRVTGVSPAHLSASVAVGGSAAVTPLTVDDASASRLVAGGSTSLWAYVAKGSDNVRFIDFDNLNVTQLEEVAAPSGGSAPLIGVPAR